jgi:hypothetical protein
MEEHFFFTYNKTKDEKYLDLLNQTREIRKNLLKEIVKNPQGEVWCISKHLLATTMRLMEVGTKKLSDGEIDKAKDLFDKSYFFWNLFWGLNLGIINIKDIDNPDENLKQSKPQKEETQTAKDEEINLLNDDNSQNKKLSVFSKLGKMIEEILDCCKE